LVEPGVNAPTVEGCEGIALALKVTVSELFDFDSPLPEKPHLEDEKLRPKRPRGRPRLNP
tara:strand:- start:186 stop:365 length:180 start_codon:yes stop_codon:yes gene_type:complete